jgi:membrane associated rhomboid family serine protease
MRSRGEAHGEECQKGERRRKTVLMVVLVDTAYVAHGEERERERGFIGPIREPRKMREWALVLSSMNIACSARETLDGWIILVSDGDYARAIEAIRLYEIENRDWPPRQAREELPYPRTLMAPAVFFTLLLFFALSGPSAGGSAWFDRGAAVSQRIVHGELWRAVTALTLHADTLHVVGNVLSGSIFLSAVNRRLGDGRGPFFVVLAGGVGNLANALWHRAGHISIGASTAVFAAVGILAATQLAVDRHSGTRSLLARTAPIVGGLALLGMLGASPHADLLAHLYGLLAGFVLALPFALLGKTLTRTAWWTQAAFGVATVALVAVSWGLAFRL